MQLLVAMSFPAICPRNFRLAPTQASISFHSGHLSAKFIQGSGQLFFLFILAVSFLCCRSFWRSLTLWFSVSEVKGHPQPISNSVYDLVPAKTILAPLVSINSRESQVVSISGKFFHGVCKTRYGNTKTRWISERSITHSKQLEMGKFIEKFSYRFCLH